MISIYQDGILKNRFGHRSGRGEVLPLVIEFKNEVKASLLKRSIEIIIQNNEVLLSRIDVSEKKISPADFFEIVFKEFNKKLKTISKSHVINFINSYCNLKRFKPNRYLFDVGFIHLDANSTIVVLIFDKILVDYQSVNVIFNEICSVYGQLNNGVITPIGSSIDFFKFAKWQRLLSERYLESMLFYWRMKLKNANFAHFEPDKHQRKQSTPDIHMIRSQLEKGMAQSLFELCLNQKMDVEASLIAIVNLLIFNIVNRLKSEC